MFQKKTPYFIFGTVIFAFVLICSLYGLGLIFGPKLKPEINLTYEAEGYGYTYTGTMLDGKMSGYGNITFSDGSRYEGGFADGHFHGEGIFFSSDGWQYQGLFDGGSLTGEGILTDSDGNVYEGIFKQGVFNYDAD